MSVEEHKEHGINDIGFAAVTVSDTRTEADDKSGDLIEKLIVEAGHRVVHRDIVKDDRVVIAHKAGGLLRDEEVQAVIFCGGTGISDRDVTVEAVVPILEKELTGFGELFRVMSMEEIGSAAMMSRATAGVVSGKVVFCIPGSSGAVKLAMKELILKECGHILWEANK